MTAYATTSQLKQVLGIAEADTSQDPYLAALLDRATAFIEIYTGRSWSTTETTVTDELYERQGRTLWLNSVGISEVTSVKVRDLRSDSWTTLAASSYQWTSAGRLELPISYDYVQVTYKTASTGIPSDIEDAALEIAAQSHRSSGENGAVKSHRIGDVSITYGSSDATSAGSHTMRALDIHRVRAV